MPDALTFVIAGIALVVGAGASYLYLRFISNNQIREAERLRDRISEEAATKQKQILLEAQAEAIRIRNEAEAEVKERRADLARAERRLQQKEENLDRKIEALERREQKIQARDQESERIRNELEKIKQEQMLVLQQRAEMTKEEAKAELLRQVEAEAREDAARIIRQIESEAKEEAERRAQMIVAYAIQRIGTEYASEVSVSTVPLPNEDMKGRIIGKEGRNIRAFEEATGVDVIIDDTPEVVTLSAFDPIRREVARRALTKLISDGRIHPARIEELVSKAQQEVEAEIKEAGEQAAMEAGVQGLHPELIRLLGRLKYRTSYGQNQLRHAVETSLIAAALAAELGADVNVAKTAGLLHDIGKAVSHEVEGPHALIGAEIARRLGRSPKIVHAIAAHHEEEEPQTVEAVIVAAADAISGSRPGARRESVEQYIKRLQALEEVANSFEGVEKSYAIQAGREIRIIVKPDHVDDLEAAKLARNVVRKIEESLSYPGQIKVTVIRETRNVEYAR
ncbi:RNA binding metal dependent phosphohydrolase [Thermobaculum terrenum ATCC BAA-798]|uniref:Ribonuclease Y n=1 Tax=Thermobaculum terrenum (strain ATCC BAA-798 / CCMEE 7001 / YNP1) TaxID=525904 RepID=D1CCE9_THET1|nr:ribonuclease Y [Thermobaculum terrenum]ACZ42464.1 RNA binding metal dependent phosphohydrolase [Thermobaculum terrenum ATCC BAA-798]